MRFIAQILTGIVLLTLVTAAAVVGLSWSEVSRPEGEGDTEGSADGGVANQIQLTALPAIAHHGVRPAPGQRAEVVLTARAQPPTPGSVFLLERATPSGWRTVDSAQQDRNGAAVFTRPAPRGARTALRVIGLGADGRRSDASNLVRPTARWSLSFADDFDDDLLAEGRWSHRQLGTYNPLGSRTCSMSDTRAAFVEDGTLKLQVLKDPSREGEPCYTNDHGVLDYYLNGHVSTGAQFAFRHGVAAARIKFPRGRGQHGAFWMKPISSGRIPGDPRRSGAEIDVVEFFGEGYPGGGLASFLYYLNEDGENEKVGGVWPKATKQLPPGDAWWRSFHVFSVEWTPEEYVFRVDGREIFRTSEGVSGVEQFLILSLLSSDWELPDLDESTLPTTMEVDWVRVWQRERPQG